MNVNSPETIRNYIVNLLLGRNPSEQVMVGCCLMLCEKLKDTPHVTQTKFEDGNVRQVVDFDGLRFWIHANRDIVTEDVSVVLRVNVAGKIQEFHKTIKN